MVKIKKETPSTEMSLEVKIFIVGAYFQELLDEAEYDTRFKQGLKYNIKNIQRDLEKMLDVVISTDELSLYISQATRALENAFEYEYS
tara:strand:- start:159 stop:422 length:264 start_codon:yes stop_codon:yes gene_type:complete